MQKIIAIINQTLESGKNTYYRFRSVSPYRDLLEYCAGRGQDCYLPMFTTIETRPKELFENEIEKE